MKVLSVLSLGIGLAFLLSAGNALGAKPAADEVEIVDAGLLTTKPELKHQPRLKFRKKNVTGEVVLRFVVTKEGKVENIVIVSFNDPDFVEPAYEAYEKADYRPGKLDSAAVATRLEVALTFPKK